jgi:2-polyprenyl-6-methoxyphenol hydroxylase-like FAD-dependent oxidoreductase
MLTDAPNSDPVLIVGGGPSGLVVAAELARRDIPARIIDIAREATDKSKAIGIQARTLELLNNFGIVDEFTSRGHQVVGANIFHDSKQLAHISLSEIDSPFHYILILPQNETETILTKYLGSLGVSIEREVKLSGFTQNEEGVTASLVHADGTEEEFKTPWLIGCDGSHSTVRHLLNLPFKGEEYLEGYQLADIKLDWRFNNDELYVFMHNGRVLAVFPMPEGRHRLIADRPPEETPTDQSPTLEEWQELVNERCPAITTLSDPLWTANYRIHRRLVPDIRMRRVFLVGDAAHIHSPAFAQGMNTGIQDGINLAWKLALVIQGGSNAKLLESYQAERYPVERDVLQATDVPFELLGFTNPIATAVRDTLITAATSFEPVRKLMRGFVSETGISYSTSGIVEEHGLSAGPHAGQRIFDCTVGANNGQKFGMFDLLRDPEHKALIFEPLTITDEAVDEVSKTVDVFRQILGSRVKTHRFSSSMDTSNKRDAEDFVYSAYEGSLVEKLGALKGAVYLIRPDNYVAFRSPLTGASNLLRDYLNKVFRAKAETTL